MTGGRQPEPIDPHAVLERCEHGYLQSSERYEYRLTNVAQVMRDAEALARAAIHLRELAERVNTSRYTQTMREDDYVIAEVLRVFGGES